MTLKNMVLQSFLRRLGYDAAGVPHERRVAPSPLSDSECEKIVSGALLPNLAAAIDVTFANLHPIKNDAGFSSVLHLWHVADHMQGLVLKVLSAGSALGVVRPDRVGSSSYQVHSDYYKLLARLHSDAMSAVSGSAVYLKNGLRSADVNMNSASDSDIYQALQDVAAGSSNFAIVARSDAPFADYIQVAGPAPFRVECRVWLNNSFAEHFHILSQTHDADGNFANLQDVARIVLHWRATGRVPEDVALRNMTRELDDPEKDASDAGPTA